LRDEAGLLSRLVLVFLWLLPLEVDSLEPGFRSISASSSVTA
jgi:hypothetical protein